MPCWSDRWTALTNEGRADITASAATAVALANGAAQTQSLPQAVTHAEAEKLVKLPAIKLYGDADLDPELFKLLDRNLAFALGSDVYAIGVFKALGNNPSQPRQVSRRACMWH